MPDSWELDTVGFMKALFVAVIMLATATSILAQGQIVVEGGLEIQQNPIGENSGIQILERSTSVTQPPLDENLATGSYGTIVTETFLNFDLRPQPTVADVSPSVDGVNDMSVDFFTFLAPEIALPSVQSQSLTIQSVPEPSTVALGSLGVGTIMLWGFCKRHRRKSPQP